MSRGSKAGRGSTKFRFHKESTGITYRKVTGELDWTRLFQYNIVVIILKAGRWCTQLCNNTICSLQYYIVLYKTREDLFNGGGFA